MVLLLTPSQLLEAHGPKQEDKYTLDQVSAQNAKYHDHVNPLARW